MKRDRIPTVQHSIAGFFKPHSPAIQEVASCRGLKAGNGRGRMETDLKEIQPPKKMKVDNQDVATQDVDIKPDDVDPKNPNRTPRQPSEMAKSQMLLPKFLHPSSQMSSMRMSESS